MVSRSSCAAATGRTQCWGVTDINGSVRCRAESLAVAARRRGSKAIAIGDSSIRRDADERDEAKRDEETDELPDLAELRSLHEDDSEDGRAGDAAEIAGGGKDAGGRTGSGVGHRFDDCRLHRGAGNAETESHCRQGDDDRGELWSPDANDQQEGSSRQDHRADDGR